MPTKTTTLWTIATVKTYCKAGAADHDAVLTTIADGVSEKVDTYIRRPLVTRSVVETRDGNDTEVLQLRHFPVQAITQVRMRASLLDAWQVITSDFYELDGFHGYLYLKALTWPAGTRTCEVTYDAGFAAQGSLNLPQDVSQAALDFVKFVYDRWKSDTVSLGSLNLQQGGSAVIVPNLPKDVTDTLERFVKRRL